MTNDELVKILSDSANEGILDLTSKSNSLPEITSFFDEFFPEQSLAIKNVSLSPEGMTVNGEISLFSFAGEATAAFSIVNNRVELALTIAPPLDWKITDSFPKLENYDQYESVLGHFLFVFTTSADNQQANRQHFVRGLNIQASVSLHGFLQPVKWFFMDAEKLELAGPVTFKQGIPEMCLHGSLEHKLTKIGYFQLPMELQFITRAIEPDSPELPAQVEIFFKIITTIKFSDNQKEFKIPLSTSFHTDFDTLIFAADLKEVSLMALSSLEGLVNDAGLTNVLPKSCGLDRGLCLSDVSFTVMPKLKSLASVRLRVASTEETWEITDSIAVSGVRVDFIVNNPAEPQSRQIHCQFGGEINIDKQVQINVSGSLPDLRMIGNLAENNEIQLSNLLEYFIPTAVSMPDGFPELSFYELEIAIDPLKGKYIFGGQASGTFTIIPQLPATINVRTDLDISLPAKGKTQPNVNGSIEGTLLFCGVEASIYAELKKELVLGGQIPKLDLADFCQNLFKTELPPGFPTICFENNEIEFRPAEMAFHIKNDSRVASNIPIRNKDCAVNFGLDIKYKDKTLTGTLDGSLMIGEVAFGAEFNVEEPKLDLKLDEGSTLNFKEVAEFLLGDDLFKALPDDLTLGLAGVQIDTFKSSIDFANKGIALEVSTSLNNITFDTDDLLLEKTSLTLKLNVSDNKKYCLVDVSGAGHIGSAVIFEECKFIFEYAQHDENTDWKLGGVFDAEILGQERSLTAAFEDKDDVRTLTLEVKGFTPIEFDGVGKFKLDDFTLRVEKKPDQKVVWDLSTTFQLSTDADMFELRNGTVGLINEKDKSGLKLRADGIDMQIPGLDHLPWFSLDQAELELEYKVSTKQWSCHGETGFMAHNVPDVLTRVFQFEKVVTKCTINEKKAEFSIGLKEGLIQIPAPMDVGDFGHAYMGVDEITIDLKNGGSLTAKLKFGLPKGLNTIFQPDPEAEDKLEIFRVYDPDKEENQDLLGLNLIINAEGLQCQLDQSPFKFFEFTEDDSGRKIIDFDLKDFGHFSLDIPVFSLETDGSFKAAGGFDIDKKKPLQVPLTPFIYLMEQVKLEEAAKALPKGIPIKGVQFYSKKDGFQCDAFFDLFMLDGKQVPLPGWLREGFDAVDDIMNRLPHEFLKYGNIEIPNHLHFNIDFSADGSLNFQLSVKDPDPTNKEKTVPLKMLLPVFPHFIGIELNSISFGEMFGGALLRLDLDAKIDSFDLPSLLAALLIPYDNIAPEIRDKLPNPKCFQNTFTAENLLLAIVYQAGIPIPIPLFYDKLGITYKGLEGLEIESSYSFPKPELKISDFTLLLGELKGFFTEDERRMDLVKLEDQISFLDYKIGPNYIRLPKYISTEEDNPKYGKLLGTEEGFTISPVKLLGAVLNAIKFQSINDLIQVVEVDKRVGDVELHIFDILNVHYQYAFTTPFEFIDYAYKELWGLAKVQAETQAEKEALAKAEAEAKAQAREFIKILPPQKTGIPEKIDGEYRYETVPVTDETQGLVIFLKGDLNIAETLFFDTGFGLVATGEGFGMGMNFDGTMSDVFNIHMQGLVGITTEGEFLLTGESRITLVQQNILSGYFRFNNEGFKIEAKAGDGPVTVQGLLEGEFTNDVFRLEGKTSLVFFGLSADGEAKFLITDSEKLIYLHGDIEIGNFIKLNATFKTFADLQQAGMCLSMYGKLSELLELKLEGAALYSEKRLQVKGDAWMKLLEQRVIAASFEYADNVLTFNGRLDLFPGNELVEVKGDVTGMLASDKFELTGNSNIIVVKYQFATAAVLITDREFSLATKLFDWKTLLIVKKETSGVTLFGTMSPIIFGNLLQITGAKNAIPITGYELGGPSIYISTSADPELAGFALNGRINILGIEFSQKIFFNKKGFLFHVEGSIFNLITATFTVSGIDLNDSNKIFISGSIETGDLEMQATLMINDIARDIVDKLKITEGKMADATAYLNEQQVKVNKLKDEINRHKAQIRSLKEQIKKKKDWYNRLHWTVKPWKLAELGVFVAAKGLAIAGLYAAIGVLEALRLTALGLLEIAKAAIGTARLVLTGAARITEASAALANNVIDAAGNFLTIHGAEFSTDLNSVCEGSTTIKLDVTFLGDRKSHNINFNFLTPRVGGKSLADALTTVAEIPADDKQKPTAPSGLTIS